MENLQLVEILEKIIKYKEKYINCWQIFLFNVKNYILYLIEKELFMRLQECNLKALIIKMIIQCNINYRQIKYQYIKTRNTVSRKLFDSLLGNASRTPTKPFCLLLPFVISQEGSF